MIMHRYGKSALPNEIENALRKLPDRSVIRIVSVEDYGFRVIISQKLGESWRNLGSDVIIDLKKRKLFDDKGEVINGWTEQSCQQ